MSLLVDRKTQLILKTATTVKESGKARPVIIEPRANYAIVRLAGSKTKFPVSWEKIYELGEVLHAQNLRLEKAAAKQLEKEIKQAAARNGNRNGSRSARKDSIEQEQQNRKHKK